MPSIKYNCICWNYLDLPKRTANTVYFCKQVSGWYCDQNKVGNWSGSWLAESSYWLLWWQSTWGTFKLTPVPNILLRFLGWTTCFPETVCNRGLRYVFSCLVGVSEISAQSERQNNWNNKSTSIDLELFNSV